MMQSGSVIGLSKKEGKSYRLPTEAEWEYACRRRDNDHYLWSGAEPTRNGANQWRIKEFVQRCLRMVPRLARDVPVGRPIDPTGPTTGIARVIRGGE